MQFPSPQNGSRVEILVLHDRMGDKKQLKLEVDVALEVEWLIENLTNSMD